MQPAEPMSPLQQNVISAHLPDQADSPSTEEEGQRQRLPRPPSRPLLLCPHVALTRRASVGKDVPSLILGAGLGVQPSPSTPRLLFVSA